MKARLAIEKDLDSIIRLWNQNLDVLYRPFKGAVEMGIQADNYLVLEQDKQIVGFVTYSYKSRLKEFRVEHLCVDARLRRVKLGTMLLKFVIGYFNKLNWPIYAECIEGAPNNAFWLKYGNIVMRKELSCGITKLKINIQMTKLYRLEGDWNEIRFERCKT